MKKIFTLAIASLLTLSMFAADRKPSVTLTTTKKYEVVIDGRSYASAIGTTMNVSNMYNGRHTIKVYALKNNGFFSKQKKLVSSSTFQLTRNDVNISVDRFGSVNVQEQRASTRYDDRNDHKDWNDKGGRNNDRNDHNDQHDQRRF
ncbi:MAG: hypothetical protein ABI480_09270 [Chitinophagaceae bacterium]